MATAFQVTIDCIDPDRLARFWATALRYQLEDPPDGFESWASYWRSRGLPESELDDGTDSVVDPDGVGPRIWFQKVPEPKVGKNRLHLDLDAGGGSAVPLDVRRARVTAEAERLEAAGATRQRVLDGLAIGHFGIVLQDPEGNEFCVH